MPTVRKSISIHAPVTKVFDFIADPAHLPSIWPSMVSVANVATRSDGAAAFDWVYRMAGFKLRGHTEPVEFVRDQRNVTKSEGGIPNTFRWLYATHDDVTDVTLEVDYRVPILGRLADRIVGKINEREAATLLANLKRVMEEAPAGRSAAPS